MWVIFLEHKVFSPYKYRSLHYVAHEMSARLKLGLKCQGATQGNQSVKVVEEMVAAIEKRLELTDHYMKLKQLR